ncbi:MAG: hypothetical protein ACI88H_001287 [Cocleimonas sp.]|jgi:hypothetical protein
MKLWKVSKRYILSSMITVIFLAGNQHVFAYQDVTPGIATGAPGEPYIANNGFGQALIFPYYTVRGGKSSSINVFNASPLTVATKVRFHESHNSRVVLDFTLILSAFDKWSGTISDNGVGGVVFKTNDNSCTVPQIPFSGIDLDPTTYNSFAFNDAGSQTFDRMKEGYVEVIAMGVATPANRGFAFGGRSDPNIGNVAWNATHVNGVPRSCLNVNDAFVVGSGTSVGQGSPTSGSGLFTTAESAFAPLNVRGGNGAPLAASEFDGLLTSTNPIRGALTIIDLSSGVGFGTPAVAIANYQDPVAITASSLNGIGSTNNFGNLITAQALPYNVEPTLASRDGLWTTTGLVDVEFTMLARTVVNEWANNPNNGANTDWLVQFPTKRFHVDVPWVSQIQQNGCRDNNIHAATNKWRNNGLAGTTNVSCISSGSGPSLALTLAPFTSRFTATGSPVGITMTTIDKEGRRSVGGGVSTSPAQPFSASANSNALPWESNLITFSGAFGVSVLASNSPELSFSPSDSIVNADSNGQALMEFTTKLPVVGFVAKERNGGDATLSFGQIMQHSYQ